MTSRHDGGVTTPRDVEAAAPRRGEAAATDTDGARADQAAVDEVPVDDDVEPPPWYADRTLLLVVLLLGVGVFFVVRGLLVGITGDDQAALPDLIEEVNPVPDAVQVLNQGNIFVDLAAGHTGVLVIDGVEIDTVNIDEIERIDVEPGQQVDLPPVTIYEAGNATLTFTPNPEAPVTQFVDGEHTATVIYWRVDEGRQRARSFTWTFNVV